jgi:hypothetical protein
MWIHWLNRRLGLMGSLMGSMIDLASPLGWAINGFRLRVALSVDERSDVVIPILRERRGGDDG